MSQAKISPFPSLGKPSRVVKSSGCPGSSLCHISPLPNFLPPGWPHCWWRRESGGTRSYLLIGPTSVQCSMVAPLLVEEREWGDEVISSYWTNVCSMQHGGEAAADQLIKSSVVLAHKVARPDLCAMSPGMKEVGIHLLLLPVTTATIECCFSSLTRILCSESSRLLPDHVNELISISIEGMEVPDTREATEDERITFKKFINRVVQNYNKKPRRM
nr:uncharacterized protein LOC125638024 isoform X2 [Caretta caretta]